MSERKLRAALESVLGSCVPSANTLNEDGKQILRNARALLDATPPVAESAGQDMVLGTVRADAEDAECLVSIRAGSITGTGLLGKLIGAIKLYVHFAEQFESWDRPDSLVITVQDARQNLFDALKTIELSAPQPAPEQQDSDPRIEKEVWEFEGDWYSKECGNVNTKRIAERLAGLIDFFNNHDAELSAATQRAEAAEDLLRSACAIAKRRGEGTAWKRFTASCAEIGINWVTARTYRVLPDDDELFL